ncbi:MAG TPA: hypothetical protein VMW95_05005, partial [Desulfobacterales bacterium]|nr:hypothetical protein [Desulfobacterales bacterium]
MKINRRHLKIVDSICTENLEHESVFFKLENPFQDKQYQNNVKRDDYYSVAMIEFIQFLDSPKPSTQSSKFIQSRIPAVIRTTVA